MGDAWQFTRGVAAHWVVLAGGALIGAALAVAAALGVEVPAWMWWVVLGATFVLACFRAWRDMRNERDLFQERAESRNAIDLELASRPYEEVGRGVFKLAFDLTNNGRDGDFVALVQEVHDLPVDFPAARPYGGFNVAWEGTTNDTRRIYGDGNHALVVIGYWVRDERRFAFSLPSYPGGGDQNAVGIRFHPPPRMTFDLEVRDVERHAGRRFRVHLDFDRDNQLPVAATIE